jgi:aspartyl-tRNA(Asn)/glutamyl-tRNA(Gln) amidotransferase subunit A
MIFEINEKLKSKKFRVQDLVQKCLGVLRTSENKNNAYISILDHQAELKAKECDSLLEKSAQAKHPLMGIPFSLKDLFITKGIRTTAGSRHLANYVPPFDGHVSEKLQSTNGILIGKNGCDEFGMGSTNENTPFGSVTLPQHPNYVAGGSSGGSAASVAEGSSIFSIGTDTGGSVRLPANFCGLVGFKPSYGVVSRYGQIAYASSLDQSSPLAVDVSDVAVIMEELSKPDARDASQTYRANASWIEKINQCQGKKSLTGKVIGYDPKLWAGCAPEIQKLGNDWIKHFQSQGMEIVEIPMPSFEYAVATYYLVAPSEASANLARYDGIVYGYRTKNASSLESLYVASRSESLGEEVKRRILVGTFALSSGYSDDYFAKAAKVRRLVWNDFQNAFQKCHFYFTPVCATTSFLKREFSSAPVDPLKDYMNDLYTIPVNLAGVPAISLPTAKNAQDFPMGFQLIGPTFSDQELLCFARDLELELPIHHEAKKHWKDFL